MKKLNPLTTAVVLLTTVAILPSSARADQHALATTPRAPRLVQRSADPIEGALEEFKEAESETDKADARAKLRELLNGEYDRLMEFEAQELKKLEQRLAELREQLDRRRAAKAKMVDLRLETLVSEAEGFGWPSQRSRASTLFGRGSRLRSTAPGQFPAPPAPPEVPVPAIRGVR